MNINWKEFFKPTKIKIIFIFVLFVLSFFIGFKHVPPKCNMVGCYSTLECNKIIFPLSYGMIPAFFQMYPPYAFVIMFGIIYIAGISYWYIALCVIIFVFEKLKKRLS